MVAWRVGRRWRRRPPDSSWKRSSRPSSSMVGDEHGAPATAASSMARGRPSRRRQMAATVSTVSGARVKPGSMATARSTNRAMAGSSSPSVPRGPTGYTRSPSTSSHSRLVARMAVSPPARSTASASPAQASTTCSQLSRMRSIRRPDRYCGMPSRGSDARTSMPMVPATADPTPAGSVTEVRSTNQHAVAPAGQLGVAHVDGQAGLARAADRDEGHQAVLGQEQSHRPGVLGPAQQRGWPGWAGWSGCRPSAAGGTARCPAATARPARGRP